MVIFGTSLRKVESNPAQRISGPSVLTLKYIQWSIPLYLRPLPVSWHIGCDMTRDLATSKGLENMAATNEAVVDEIKYSP